MDEMSRSEDFANARIAWSALNIVIIGYKT